MAVQEVKKDSKSGGFKTPEEREAERQEASK